MTSTLTFLEVLVPLYRTGDDEKRAGLSALFASFPGVTWIALDLPVADRAAALRARYRLRTPDAIQLATALQAGADIFLTKVYIGMQSAELAARVIAAEFRRGDFRAARFAAYRRRITRGTDLFFWFIEQYYDPACLDVLLNPDPPRLIERPIRDVVTAVLVGGGLPAPPARDPRAPGAARLDDRADPAGATASGTLGGVTALVVRGGTGATPRRGRLWRRVTG